MVKTTARLYERIYNNSRGLKTMDDIFSLTASFNTPGYIAMLQKYLVVKKEYVFLLQEGECSNQLLVHFTIVTIPQVIDV